MTISGTGKKTIKKKGAYLEKERKLPLSKTDCTS
jgi:hypothetical protein